MSGPFISEPNSRTIADRLNRGGFVITRPLLDYNAPAVETQIVSVRPPQYGITLAQRRTLLGQVLPNGVDRYVGYFTSLPNADGTGGTEASGAAYTRIAHSRWAFDTTGYIIRRINVGPITWPELTASIALRGWGIWDAETAGNLVGFGLLRTSGGAPIVQYLSATDQPRLSHGQLRVGFR